MTAPSPEQFKSDHPDVDVEWWPAVAVIRGSPTKENHGWGEGTAYSANPGEAPMVRTSNWKGYRECYSLSSAGVLTLDAFKYDDRNIPPRIVNERIQGDFYVVLRSRQGPRQYVTFQGGQLVTDRRYWLHEAYVGPSPLATELRHGPHPDYPEAAALWYELPFPK